MTNFRTLRVYQDSMELVLAVYRYTADLPLNERYNLRSQLRRCAVSIPSNVAEGCGRGSRPSLALFISNAIGSAYEAETQLRIANSVGYAQCDELIEHTVRVQKQLVAFHKRLVN